MSESRSKVTPVARRSRSRLSPLEGVVDVAGPETAPPIVLLHGIGATRKQWAPQVRGLADAYRLIAPDLPGHGAFLGKRFTFDEALAHLDLVIDELAGGRALVAGVSLGGYVAAAAAARSPKRFAGLALTGCSGSPHGLFTIVPSSMALFSRAIGERTLSCLNRRNLKSRYSEEVAHEQEQAGLSFTATQDALSQLSGRDFLRSISAYRGPTILINGERDSLFRLEELTFLTAAQDGVLQLIRGAGHTANLEAPEAYERALRRFALSINWR